MYGFLILLPLTLISAVIGWLIGTSAQVADYVTYISDISAIPDVYKEALNNQRVWMRIGAHVVAYVILCFALVSTVRTISAPLPPERPLLLRTFQLILEMIFVAVPTLVLLKINGYALLADPGNPVHMLTVALLVLGLIATVMLTVTRRPLELYATFDTPFSLTKTDIGASLCLLLGAGLIAVFALFPIEAATIVGMFPVLMLATSVAFLVIAAIFSRNASPVAVVSALITTVMALNVIDRFLPPREFRHTKLAIAAPAPGTELTVADVKAKRQIPKLSDAFLAWLQARKPAIDAYKEKGRVFPIFFASAQGGGMYAAYHPALALARLTDACPEFPQHLFGISSVSGGSLGAAVYAELLRTLPKAPEYTTARARLGCTSTRGPKDDNYLQGKVEAFFTTDFLSPVVASAFIYDLPSLLVPQLRFGQDRARALEHGFETAFRKLGAAVNRDGLSENFFERWQPNGVAPALFMSTTGVNFGIPVLVSQVDWSYSASRFVPATSVRAPTAAASSTPGAATGESDILETVRRKMDNPNDGLQVGVGNILDFRPDIQLATSTAVVLSARFPFVTPPGAISDSTAIKPNPLYQKTQVLEMTDGAFYDNSGAIVARDIVVEMLRILDRDERFRDYREAVRFELIRFTDTPAKRHSEASQGVHFELVTPLVAYDAVRQSRGVLLPNPPQGVARHEIYLLDEWYEGTLNWLLTRETKTAIEKRASWLLYDNDVCCEVTDPKIRGGTRRVPLKPQEVEVVRKAGYQVNTFIPNAQPFNNILRLVGEGAAPRTATPTGGRPTAPQAPAPQQAPQPTQQLLLPPPPIPPPAIVRP